MKIHEIREVPRYLRQRARMPIARFELVSSLDEELLSVALNDVVLLDPELFRELDGLEPEQFSAPHLGKAYGLLRRRWREGRGVTLAALEGQLAPEELDGLTAAAQQPQARNTAREALEDCKQTILAESRRGNIHSAEDLNGLQQALKQKKAYGG